ncbi:1468_t:CDS:2, partial [Racocetra fulgida]
LVQTCFKLLTVMMRVGDQVEIKENQLTFLINLIRPDLEEPQRQNTTFSLIKAIISRKLVVPEIYDLMQTISEIMITSQASQTCDLSRQVLFQFLLDYPQGRGRLKNQINFLIKNLNYTFESGRKSAMEMLSLIITKFGDEILMEYAEMFFMALSISLVNDESNKCREIAGVLIKVLIKRMDEQRLKNTYILLDKWFSQTEKKSLQRMAVQIYGLVIEAFEDRFKKHIPELLNILDIALQSSSQVMDQLVHSSNDAGDNQEDMMVDVDWEIGYYALNTFTKLIKAFPSVTYLEECNKIWILVERHIFHSHSWIRLASSRLFGSYFAKINPETMIATGLNKRNDFLTKDLLRKLATSFCTQLKSEHLGQELAIQIVKNLFFIGKCFYYLSPDEDKVDHSFTRERDGNHNEESISEDIDNENHDDIDDNENHDDIDDIDNIDNIETRVGTTQYHNAYNKVRQQIEEVRRERKHQRVIKAIVDPESAAKRKIQRNEMKKQNRKRKNEEFAKKKLRYGAKIYIEKDVQANEARVSLCMLEMVNEFNLTKEQYANWPYPINKANANNALAEFRNNNNCDRKQQKATQRAHAGYRRHEREQRRKRSEVQRAKRQKICIEKDIQATEACVPLRVLKMENDFDPIDGDDANGSIDYTNDAKQECKETIFELHNSTDNLAELRNSGMKYTDR